MNYKIPTMEEINSIKWNGYNVVSTFSGGGGSCLGYKLAGCKILYADEFIEEARLTYKENFKGTFIDDRDIRTVTGNDILKITKLQKGNIDILDGSPPCSAFSTAGSREKGWGKVKKYSDSKQRVDDLFFEYIRLLGELQPKVFVAENVSGLVKGKAKGYFKDILSEMKNTGYEVKARLLNAKYLGVPQSRERIIFVGVRNDIVNKYNVHPVHPKPQKQVITLGDAIKDINNDDEELNVLNEEFQKNKIGKVLRKIPVNPESPISAGKYMNGSWFNLKRESWYKPCSTVLQTGGAGAGNCHPFEQRRFTIKELKRIMSVPDDFILTGTYRQQWERLGRMVPPIMMYNIAKVICNEVLDKC